MSWLTIAVLVVVAVLAFGVLSQRMFAGSPDMASHIGAADAHDRASKGEIVLVDVRTPQEWKETGVPASAHAITMSQDGRALIAALDKALGNDRSRPLAIICRTGNRTAMLQPQLKAAGYANVLNVAEGVAGSRYGVGWYKAGLPMRPGSQATSAPVLASQ